MQVPFVDLKAQYSSIQDEVSAAINTVIDESAFIGGRFVNVFEQEFAAAHGMGHCISAGNGTDTLYVILKMLGIGPGDEVIVPANSWISSSETVTQVGARVCFVDVDPVYYSMDEKDIARKINRRTKAILAVHLQGQMCNMEAIQEMCTTHGILLIEDCAQSHFSRYHKKLAGTWGIAASFSFYPGKNLGAYGDAGCILTDQEDLALKVRRFARHGALIKHRHEIEGINSRMDGLQAAILSVKLKHIHRWTEKRIEHAERYVAMLREEEEIVLPQVRPGTRHTYHLFVIRARKRDSLMQFLKMQGIETAVHYPTPLPFLDAYRYLGHVQADFPSVSALRDEILSLPIFPELAQDQLEHVVEQIKAFYRK